MYKNKIKWISGNFETARQNRPVLIYSNPMDKPNGFQNDIHNIDL